MTTHHLDAKGLTCPLPVLRARKALKALAPGDVLVVEATDPSALKDFPAFCHATGHRLAGSIQRGDVFSFTIEKAG